MYQDKYNLVQVDGKPTFIQIYINQGGSNSETSSGNRIVYSTYNPTGSSGHYFMGSGNACSVGINTSPGGYSLLVTGTCFCSSGAWSASHTRIQKNIPHIEVDEAVQKLLTIQPKKYEYIVQNHKDNEDGDVIIGFIAQHVMEVVQEAIKIKNEIIPSILKNAKYIDNKVYFDADFDLSTLSIDTKLEIKANQEK